MGSIHTEGVLETLEGQCQITGINHLSISITIHTFICSQVILNLTLKPFDFR